MIQRSRVEFWGSGPPHVEAGGFSFHHLAANPPEDEVQPHTHEEAHFVLVLSGGYMSSARDAPPVSRTPLLVYNPPGTTHRDRFFEGRGTFLAVSGGCFDVEGQAIAVRDPYAHCTARAIARDLAARTGVPLGLEGRALQLAASVLAPGSEHARRATQPPAWLRRAFEIVFLEEDLHGSVARVAAAVGVHPVHLARVFRQFLGCSPGEMLRGRRLERAAALLGRSTASLADVAHAAGYVDQAHMSHAFRGALGATPAAWRARHVANLQDALDGGA